MVKERIDTGFEYNESYDDASDESLDSYDAETDTDTEEKAGLDKENEKASVVEKTKRKPSLVKSKLDLTKILGDQGFRFLLMKSKDRLKFKGKGHEKHDLNMLMAFYQEWAHMLYPRYPFYDVVKTIEKKCHSKLAQICLERWHSDWICGIPIEDLGKAKEDVKELPSDDSIDSPEPKESSDLLSIEQRALIEERRQAALQRLRTRIDPHDDGF
jgi:hypothetical protein